MAVLREAAYGRSVKAGRMGAYILSGPPNEETLRRMSSFLSGELPLRGEEIG